MKSALAAAVAAEDQLLATARADLESRLTDAQTALWSRARANPSGCGAWAWQPIEEVDSACEREVDLACERVFSASTASEKLDESLGFAFGSRPC